MHGLALLALLLYYGPARAGPFYEIRIREAYAFLRDECTI